MSAVGWDDRQRLIGAIAAKTGIKLDPDDPAFVLVELNNLMLEAAANEAAGKIGDAANQFNTFATRNADDFVEVANEALSRFMQRTNEIKSALDELKLTKAAIEAAPTPKKIEPTGSFWIPVAFVGGLLTGVMITYLVFM